MTICNDYHLVVKNVTNFYFAIVLVILVKKGVHGPDRILIRDVAGSPARRDHRESKVGLR